MPLLGLQQVTQAQLDTCNDATAAMAALRDEAVADAASAQAALEDCQLGFDLLTKQLVADRLSARRLLGL